MIHPKERAIKERRIIEATRKNIMGTVGKLGQIAKWLGLPIIRQGSRLYDVTYQEDIYSLVDDEIPLAEDETTVMEGWAFDGLSRGMHLCIKYMHDNKQLTVDYKGYRVYNEIAGDLETYAPFSEWENMIDRLYKVAKVKKDNEEAVVKQHNDKALIEKGKNFLQMLRIRWGL